MFRAMIEGLGAWFGMPVSSGKDSRFRWIVIAVLIAIPVIALWLMIRLAK